MKLQDIKNYKEDVDSDGNEVDPAPPAAHADEDKPDDAVDTDAPADAPKAAPNDDENPPPVEGESVGSVSQAEGFEKSKKDMFAFGSTRPVTLLTKNQKIGGMDLTLQYVINPKTGAWSLRACLADQGPEDMVEFSKGEDPSSLIKSLKKKTKITPHQLVDSLNPPKDQLKGTPKPLKSDEEKPEDSDEDKADQDDL